MIEQNKVGKAHYCNNQHWEYILIIQIWHKMGAL